MNKRANRVRRMNWLQSRRRDLLRGAATRRSGMNLLSRRSLLAIATVVDVASQAEAPRASANAFWPISMRLRLNNYARRRKEHAFTERKRSTEPQRDLD